MFSSAKEYLQHIENKLFKKVNLTFFHLMYLLIGIILVSKKRICILQIC